jgi:hypothetical protein
MIAVLAAAEVPAPRVILCRVSEKPRVIELAADPDGGYTKALEGLLGDPVAHFPLLGGVRVFCDRDGLVFGLALARRALALSLAEPWQSEITLRFDGSESSLSPDEWPVSGDFLLARATDDGGLVDLTEADLKHWMFWLGFDYIMNR